MSADFTPEKEDLKILTPFKMQVLTNFPYIEADFDALTDYQLLCKVVEYLNNVIAETNEVTEQTLSLYNAFVALQNYVNNYFDNLDLTEEVSNKLDEMARDGTITNLIQAYIDPIFAEYTETVNSIIASQNENIETFRTDQVNFESSINSTVEEIREEVAAATSGSPKGVYATVDALTTADPDHDYIYLVLADGKWYYYSTGDTSWVAGGVYQASSIGDEVIDINNLVESLQTNLHQEIPTLSWTSGYYIRYDNGGVYTAGPYRLSSKIHLNKGDILTFTGSIANADIIAALSSYEYGNITNLSATNKFKPLLTFSDTSSHTVIYTATYEADYYINTLGEATNVKVYRNVYYQDNLDINDNIAFINNIIKNDSEDFTQGYYDTGNGGSNTSTQFYISDYIRIDELRDITLKTNNFKLSINVNDVGMSFFDREKNFISGVKYMPTAETNIVTTKTPKGAYYPSFGLASLFARVGGRLLARSHVHDSRCLCCQG